MSISCFGEGGLFCAVAKDGGVMMLDVRQGACRQHLQLHAPLLSCALLRQGGSQVLAAAGADGGIHLIDVDTGELLPAGASPPAAARHALQPKPQRF